jgi:hypothetical protein
MGDEGLVALSDAIRGVKWSAGGCSAELWAGAVHEAIKNPSKYGNVAGFHDFALKAYALAVAYVEDQPTCLAPGIANQFLDDTGLKFRDIVVQSFKNRAALPARAFGYEDCGQYDAKKALSRL